MTAPAHVTDDRVVARRVCAGVLMLLGLLHVAELPAHAALAPYLGVLFAATAVGFFAAAGRMWSGGHFDGRVLAASLSVLALSAQLLSLLVGLPGAPELQGQVMPMVVGALGLELVVLALLHLDRRAVVAG